MNKYRKEFLKNLLKDKRELKKEFENAYSVLNLETCIKREDICNEVEKGKKADLHRIEYLCSVKEDLDKASYFIENLCEALIKVNLTEN